MSHWTPLEVFEIAALQTQLDDRDYRDSACCSEIIELKGEIVMGMAREVELTMQIEAQRKQIIELIADRDGLDEAYKDLRNRFDELRESLHQKTDNCARLLHQRDAMIEVERLRRKACYIPIMHSLHYEDNRAEWIAQYEAARAATFTGVL